MRLSAEACLVAFPQEARAEQASSFPIPFRHIEHGQLDEESLDRLWPDWIAEQFREDDGRLDGLPVLDCHRGGFDILARVPRQVGHERTRIDRDHRRASRTALTSRENTTFPRTARNRS